MTNHHTPAAVKQKKAARPLSDEDKVVIGFSLLGLVGSVALYLFNLPSIMISIFLSAGITALLYRFLGGVQGARFSVGALKLGGTAAVLIGVAFWINGTNQLDPQRRFHVLSEDTMLGEWQWDVVGPGSSWDGHLDFVKSKGQLTFSGNEYTVDKSADGKIVRTPLLDMTNGKAALINGAYLSLESDVYDHQNNRHFHWKSVEPFSIIPAFVGRLRPVKPDDPNLESNPWGMMIYKKGDRQ